ncbi:MAG: hypothetical protein Aurels2KO_57130 [Aureliella sp.]
MSSKAVKQIVRPRQGVIVWDRGIVQCTEGGAEPEIRPTSLAILFRSDDDWRNPIVACRLADDASGFEIGAMIVDEFQLRRCEASKAMTSPCLGVRTHIDVESRHGGDFEFRELGGETISESMNHFPDFMLRICW